MKPHYHDTEFKCRKCGKEQHGLVLCGASTLPCKCQFCQADNMWLGVVNQAKVFINVTSGIPSPFQHL